MISVLKIVDVRLQDGGQYYCRISYNSSITVTSRPAQVCVTTAPSLPSSVQTLVQNSPLIITSTVLSTKEISGITWKIDGKEFNGTADWSFDEMVLENGTLSYSSIFMFTSVPVSYSGKKLSVAIESFGLVAENEVTLNVIGKSAYNSCLLISQLDCCYLQHPVAKCCTMSFCHFASTTIGAL